MVGITGTPGTGKSAAADELFARGFFVTDLKKTVVPYIIEHDEVSDTDDVDVDLWAENFPYTDGFLEGSLAHFLSCDKIIILRCRPDLLAERLRRRNYSKEKIAENCEAEALDVILCETADMFSSEQIYEIDTTYIDTSSVANQILAFTHGEREASFGTLDWSEFAENFR